MSVSDSCVMRAWCAFQNKTIFSLLPFTLQASKLMRICIARCNKSSGIYHSQATSATSRFDPKRGSRDKYRNQRVVNVWSSFPVCTKEVVYFSENCKQRWTAQARSLLSRKSRSIPHCGRKATKTSQIGILKKKLFCEVAKHMGMTGK